MSRRARLILVVFTAFVAASSTFDGPQAVDTLDQPRLVSTSEPQPPSPPPPTDPCYDYTQLEAGDGAPERQHTFDHLDARGYARWHIACVYGWGADQWECLDNLWDAESSWRHDIRNGIPQAMPESKMADPAQGGGPDYRTNPRTQVRWGARYIADRSDYGRPTRASFHGHEHAPASCHAGY